MGRRQPFGETVRVNGRDDVVVLGVDHHDVHVRERAAGGGREHEAGLVPPGFRRVPARGGDRDHALEQGRDAVAEEPQRLGAAEGVAHDRPGLVGDGTDGAGDRLLPQRGVRVLRTRQVGGEDVGVRPLQARGLEHRVVSGGG
jgi:hypothetical protein